MNFLLHGEKQGRVSQSGHDKKIFQGELAKII